MKAEGDVAFAAHPFGVIGGGAGQRGVEERLRWTTDIDDDGVATFQREGTETRAELPGGLFVEGDALELTFLKGDEGEIVGKGHNGLVFWGDAFRAGTGSFNYRQVKRNLGLGRGNNRIRCGVPFR